MIPSDQTPLTRKPNVILTGFSGTGKSSVGRFIAQRLCYGFVDTDALIEDRWGSIPKIFAEQGESTFRAFERIIAAELACLPKLVVATGGGMLLSEHNVDTLGRHGVIVCLCATPETILARVSRRPGSRPLLAEADPAERIATLLSERSEAYSKFSQVDTTNLSQTEVADRILALVQELTDDEC